MINKEKRILFTNKKTLDYKETMRNLGWSLFSLGFTYIVVAIMNYDIDDFISFLPYFLIFLLIQNLIYLLRKHTYEVYFTESEEEIVVIQKNLLGMQFEYNLKVNEDSLLSHLSDSYGRVNFDIKHGRKSVYLSSDQIGLSKKKVKKIYRELKEFSTQYKWNTTI